MPTYLKLLLLCIILYLMYICFRVLLSEEYTHRWQKKLLHAANNKSNGDARYLHKIWSIQALITGLIFIIFIVFIL
jgi:3-deoxy-D-manno-octulosonic-acid transferase